MNEELDSYEVLLQKTFISFLLIKLIRIIYPSFFPLKAKIRLMDPASIKKKVSEYYTKKLDRWGSTPQGVDWNSRESHEIRFEQLLKICSPMQTFSINDLGCGFGALFDYMTKNQFRFQYFGYDLSASMIKEAKKLHPSQKNCHFEQGDTLTEADFSVACGLFNVKLDVPENIWRDYVFNVLHRMDQASRRGFSFNILTKYSDKEYMKDYLYYPDPGLYFDYCKVHFSKNVSLLHDYSLYEFTILVRKDS